MDFSESTQIETVRQTATPYQVYEAEKRAIQTAIVNKELLLGQRLASRYHEQWDKSESLLKDIEALNTDLRQLIEKSTTVGFDTAQTQASTSAFFLQLSIVLQVSHTLVTTVNCQSGYTRYFHPYYPQKQPLLFCIAFMRYKQPLKERPIGFIFNNTIGCSSPKIILQLI